MGVHVGQKLSSMNSVSRLTNRVQRTRFTSPETEFIELGLQSQKPSPLYLVSFESTCPSSNALKKFLKTKHSVSKYTVSHSHSLSLSVSLSLSHSPLNLSLSLTLTLLLHLRRCRRCAQSLIPSRSIAVAVAPVFLSPPRLVFLPQWLALTISQK